MGASGGAVAGAAAAAIQSQESEPQKRKTETGKLQDINAMIKLVERERGSVVRKVLNRIMFFPFKTFTSTEEWLEILYFERKQEEERIRFYNQR